jgi:hypothetical protein
MGFMHQVLWLSPVILGLDRQKPEDPEFAASCGGKLQRSYHTHTHTHTKINHRLVKEAKMVVAYLPGKGR